MTAARLASRTMRRRRGHHPHLQRRHRGSRRHVRDARAHPRPTSAQWFDGRHPIVVVEVAGRGIVAFASTSTYRARECYAGIAEFSVYVARAARGLGAGRVAMDALIDAAAPAGFWKLVSRVFVENTASRRLLRRVGFREVGVYEKHAQLDGVWRDVVIVERLIPENQHA